MYTHLRSLFAAVTSATALLHLVSLSAFAVAALVVTADPGGRAAPEHEPRPPATSDVVAADEPDRTVRVSVLGNLVAVIDLPLPE